MSRLKVLATHAGPNWDGQGSHLMKRDRLPAAEFGIRCIEVREGAIPEAEVARRAEKGRGTLSVAAKVLCWPLLVQHGKCDLVEQGIALSCAVRLATVVFEIFCRAFVGEIGLVRCDDHIRKGDEPLKHVVLDDPFREIFIEEVGFLFIDIKSEVADLFGLESFDHGAGIDKRPSTRVDDPSRLFSSSLCFVRR